jgi:hypothetical protein
MFSITPILSLAVEYLTNTTTAHPHRNPGPWVRPDSAHERPAMGVRLLGLASQRMALGPHPRQGLSLAPSLNPTPVNKSLTPRPPTVLAHYRPNSPRPHRLHHQHVHAQRCSPLRRPIPPSKQLCRVRRNPIPNQSKAGAHTNLPQASSSSTPGFRPPSPAHPPSAPSPSP